MTQYIHINQLNEAMNGHVHLMSNIIPGMGATRFVGSDRYAMVVTKVVSPKKVMVAHLKDNHIDKMIEKDGCMYLPEEYLKEYENLSEYSYYASTEYSLRKNKRWMEKGSGLWDTGSIMIGYAENYRDPCF